MYATISNPYATANIIFQEFNSRFITANVAKQGTESKQNNIIQNACKGVYAFLKLARRVSDSSSESPSAYKIPS